jgi:hypothetical protein
MVDSPEETTDRLEVTAYVLGELSGEEKTSLEIEFDRDATLRIERAELRTLSDLVARELAAEPDNSGFLALTIEQKGEILRRATQIASVTPPPPAIPAPASGPDLWDRLELLMVFVALQILGFVLPHLTDRINLTAGALKARLKDSAEAEPTDWFWFLDGRSAGYFRASLGAALLAVIFYAWIRLRRRRPASGSAVWGALVIYLITLSVLRFIKA